MDKEQDLGIAAPEQKLYVGGHWLEGREWFEVRDKISGDVLASVPICEDELLEMAVQASHDGFLALESRFPSERSKGLAAWARALDAQRSTLLPLVHRESAVPMLWADEEIRQAVAVLQAASAESSRIAGTQVGAASPEWLSQPLGTVAAILPERHALFFAAQIAGVAMATGCSVILMAHPLAPLAVVKLVESALTAAWPPGTVNLLYGLHTDLALRLAEDPRVALLATAGTMHHRDMLAAARGLRPQIHLGSGHGCALLDRGADVSGAVTTLLAMRFRSPRWGRPAPVFVLTPEELSARLHEALGEGVLSLPGGRPTDMTAVVPWQMTDSAAQAATLWLTNIKELGGKVAFGGRRSGLYVEPAVITAPAGTRPLPPPPPEAPFFVIDSYDKQPRAQLERFPDLVTAAVFTPDAARAQELAQWVEAAHVDVFSPAPATGQKPQSRGAVEDHDVPHLMSDMTRKKRIHLVFTS